MNKLLKPLLSIGVVVKRFFSCTLNKHDWSGENPNICEVCKKKAIGLPRFINPPNIPEIKKPP